MSRIFNTVGCCLDVAELLSSSVFRLRDVVNKFFIRDFDFFVGGRIISLYLGLHKFEFNTNRNCRCNKRYQPRFQSSSQLALVLFLAAAPPSIRLNPSLLNLTGDKNGTHSWTQEVLFLLGNLLGRNHCVILCEFLSSASIFKYAH